MMKILIGLSLAVCLARASSAASLTAEGISVLDAGGNVRATFSNSETLTLRFQVDNTVSGSQISFKFAVLNPSGSEVFTHTGNTAPGTVGVSQTQLSGIPISSFYSTPGNYTFRGEATSAPDPTVAQSVNFVIASPNITLIYPPNGATGLSDSPLTFRWIGSGASQYRLTVSENAGLYPITHQIINSGETSYSYPQNPTGPREQLVPQQMYYWKIEGLDASGNTISESNISNFSLRALASSQSRNVIVNDLSITSSLSDLSTPLNFKAVVYNAGNNAETNIGVKMSLGGISAQDSPKQIQILSAGETKEVSFTAFMPQDQESGLAVACVDIFDDNLTDNCKTKLVAKDTGNTASGGTSKQLSYDELWAELTKRLGPDALKALDGYTFQTIECANCSGSELNDILEALLSGDATLAGASISETGGAAAAPAAQTSQEATEAAAAEAESPAMDLEIVDPSASFRDEWTGYASAFSDKEISTFVVADKKEWKKLWQSLSETELPDVDFSRKMVLGIVSAAKDRAETVRILSKRKTEDGLAVDYYFIQAPKEKEVPAAAYILKVVGKETGKVNFRRLDIGGSSK